LGKERVQRILEGIGRNVLVLFFLFVFQTSRALEPSIARTLSLESGYLPTLYSHRAIWTFGGEINDVVSLGYDAVDRHLYMGEFALTRLLWGAVAAYAWLIFQKPLFVSNHEFGHGAVVSSLKGNPHYQWSNSSKSHNNIFTFFLEGYRPGVAGSAFTTGASTYGYPPSNWGIVTSAAGINNSMMYAEYVEDEAYFQRAHLLEYTGYVIAKYDGHSYAVATEKGTSGDLTALDTYYDGRGYNIRLDDYKTGSIVSRLLSATHWAFAVGVVRYLFQGDPTVVQPRLGRFRLPDISHFALRNGLSYKIRTGWEFSNYHLPIYLEYVYKGKVGAELTSGFIKKLSVSAQRKNYLSVLGVFNTQLAIGARVQYDKSFGPRLVASFGASVYQTKTYDAERYATRFLGSGVGFEGWARLSHIY
jgi:hypothetical protein